MKKIFVVCAAFAALSFTSCGKDGAQAKDTESIVSESVVSDTDSIEVVDSTVCMD